MFRVVAYKAVLRILFVCAGLLVAGATAQDQPAQKSADKPADLAAGAGTARRRANRARANTARARCRGSSQASYQ